MADTTPHSENTPTTTPNTTTDIVVPKPTETPTEKPTEKSTETKDVEQTCEDFNREEESASIIVKNVFQSNDPESPVGKQLVDFFSFCGNINSLTLIPDRSDPNTVSAVVTFESTSAARTALLLNHTLLNERSIVVELAPENLMVSPPTYPQGDIPRHFNDQGPQTQESVIRNLLNQGYQLGVDALESAKAYDEEHKISEQMNDIAKRVETRVNAIDSEYQISEKVNGVVEQVNAIDQQYGISATINDAVQRASSQVNAIDQQYGISTTFNQKLHDAEKSVNDFDTHYQISNNIVAASNKAAEESAKLLTSLNEELQLEQRTKEAQEALSYGAAQVADFLEHNETVQEIGSFLSTIGTSLWGASAEPPRPSEVAQETTHH